MDQKTMVHLHDRMLCSRKKEGASTLWDNMDRSGEHDDKWNKSGSEIQIPYYLTCRWNLINKTNKQAKYNQRHWNWEQADSDLRGDGRGEGILGEKGEGFVGTIIRDTWTIMGGGHVEMGWSWEGLRFRLGAGKSQRTVLEQQINNNKKE